MKKLKNIKYYIVEYILFTLFIAEFVLLGFSIFMSIIWCIYFIIYIYIRLKARSNKQLKYYSGYNLFVSGFKRKGKDLSIQRYIIKKYKKSYDKKVKQIKRHIKKNTIIQYMKQVASEYGYTCKENIYDDLFLDDYIDLYYLYNPNYLSNIDYGYGVRIVDMSEFKLYKNYEKTVELSFQDFLNNPDDIYMTKNLSFEGKELILSDSQLYFPASYFQTLIRKYPSFPIFFQLSGHLYDMTITINSQRYGLVWDKLRDQADLYIQAINTFPGKGLKKIHPYIPIIRNKLITKLYIYERFETAERGIFPYVPRAGIKDRAIIKADKLKFDSENGKILKLSIVTDLRDLRYDTRYFASKVFKQ